MFSDEIAVALLVACSLLMVAVRVSILALSVDEDTLELVIRGFNVQKSMKASVIKDLNKRFGNIMFASLYCAHITFAVMVLISFTVLIPPDNVWGYIVPIIYLLLVDVFGSHKIVNAGPLTAGSSSVYFVYACVFLFGIIAYPISRMCSKSLVRVYDAERRQRLFQNNRQQGHNVFSMMLHASGLNKTRVGEVMTPYKHVFRLELHSCLNFETLKRIFQSGHSRIPVYDKDAPEKSDNVVGILFTKDLILLNPNEAIPISTILRFYARRLPRIFDDTPLQECLQFFKEEKTTIALVQEVNREGDHDPFYENIGLVTLEDIMNSILRERKAGAEEGASFNTRRKRINDYRNDDAIELDVVRKDRLPSIDGFLDLKKMDEIEHQQIFTSQQQKSSVLSAEELQAVYYHLIGSVPAFKDEARPLSKQGFQNFLKQCKIFEIEVSNKENTDKEDPWMQADVSEGGRYLYQKGKPSEFGHLVLDGKLETRSGRDGFKSKLGRWAVVCGNLFEFKSLSKHKNLDLRYHSYLPDFSCKVVGTTRLLRLDRKLYVEMAAAEAMPSTLILTGHAPDSSIDNNDKKESKDFQLVRTHSKLGVDLEMKAMKQELYRTRRDSVKKETQPLTDIKEVVMKDNNDTVLIREKEDKGESDVAKDDNEDEDTGVLNIVVQDE